MAPCVIIEQIPEALQLQAWKVRACGHTFSLDHEGATKIYAHWARKGNAPSPQAEPSRKKVAPVVRQMQLQDSDRRFDEDSLVTEKCISVEKLSVAQQNAFAH